MIYNNEPTQHIDLSFFIRTGDYTKPHKHDGYWEFLYILSGEYTHKINNLQRVIKKQTLCLLRQEDYHSTFKLTEKASYVVFNIPIDFVVSFLNLINPPMLNALNNAEFIEIALSNGTDTHIRKIIDLYFCGNIDNNSATNALFLTYIESILLNFHSDKNTVQYSSGVQQFIAQLNTPLSLNMSLRDLIAQTNYSYSHFNVIFKRETGQTPAECLTARKLNYAKTLLAHQEISVKDVASQIGFANASKFCVFFKRHTNLTPSQYVNSLQSDPDNAPPPPIT